MNKKVCLMYSDQISTFRYGYDHPMEPERICMVYDLMRQLDLGGKFDIQEAYECTSKDLQKFHSKEYIDFMQNYNKINPTLKMKQKYNFDLNNDTPAFDGFFDFAKLVGGSSIQAAKILKERKYDMVINWIGGLHHAHEDQASGFCYVNDCVLAIKELLETFRRVMYVDIDIHHGDGVEQAFIYSNRVLTFSIHQYGENFFPKTGYLNQHYSNVNNNYIINIPLRKGCSDKSFRELFNVLFDRAFDKFKPDAIVLQCGADSVKGDKLGDFNLSLEGHAETFNHVRQKGVPLLCLGGGGYTQENVARCWTLESAISVGETIPLNQTIPKGSIYYQKYSSDLFYYTPNKANAPDDQNDEHYLDLIRQEVFEKLNHVHDTWAFIQAPKIFNKEFVNRIDFPEIVSVDQEINEFRNKAFEMAKFRNN